MSQRTENLTAALCNDTDDVVRRHSPLFDPRIDVIPIPFFGRIETARVVTVGLNPSDGELKNGRWPRSLSPSQINARLLAYFDDPRVSPHRWFSTWEQSLGSIGASYYDGSAAHIDLSPWPARSLKSTEDPLPLLGLIEDSLQAFSQCLDVAVGARLLLLAGTVTKRFYMPKYLSQNSHHLRFGFTGDKQGTGQAFVTWHSFELERGVVPAFFCSVSPSSRTNRQMLPIQVQVNAEKLKRVLGC